MAKQFGATDTVNAKDGDPVKQVRALSGNGVNYSFECLGAKATAEQAFRMLGPGGAATIIGMIPVGTKIELHGPDFLAERKIQGSLMGSNRFRTDMPRLIEFYLQGKLKLDHLISGHMKLAQINDGFAALRAGGAVRNLVLFDA
jgi:S-(hydroxymethyl)glutathione dehydrogenase / alcohol dehydrogenase